MDVRLRVAGLEALRQLCVRGTLGLLRTQTNTFKNCSCVDIAQTTVNGSIARGMEKAELLNARPRGAVRWLIQPFRAACTAVNCRIWATPTKGHNRTHPLEPR